MHVAGGESGRVGHAIDHLREAIVRASMLPTIRLYDRKPDVDHDLLVDPDAPPVMSERDKEVNRDLAKWLFEHVMQGRPGRTLDVGCGPYPFLANRLLAFGCDVTAIDGNPAYTTELLLQAIHVDFEELSTEDVHHEIGREFSLITMIHSFEHCYDPLAALCKIRTITHDDSHVFLRLPDHGVRGFEAHFKPAIHPFFHCLDSILEALRQTETFTVAETSVMDGAGQIDILLRPII